MEFNIKTSTIFLVCFMVIFSPAASQRAPRPPSLAAPAPPPPPPPSDLITSFVFSVTWPPTYCRHQPTTKPCKPLPQKMTRKDFVIHGLWPKKGASADYIDCPGPALQPDDIAGLLLDDLGKYWPPLTDDTTGGRFPFWRHEWDKHGKCTVSLFDATKYFSTSIDLLKNLDPLAVLRAKGYPPSDFTDRSVQDIQKAFTRKPYIACHVNDKTRVLEIRFCFDKEAKIWQDCQGSVTNCNAKVKIPSFPSSFSSGLTMWQEI